ncbi:helix-turn-helix transcriptional regulator [Nocardioides nitrophenolicus]|uniref:helix-turn-helix transcriptional regulator n=1 Tax=Nocardioides nitrophenolicus TaxID=60489 RepID=UPI001958573A|nr:LuxR C-terminal-related transcriptional regulator [Nocardioides nitrophenolicus]MBM7518675.1 DNA-binding CsgD family transcriptional regulator/uncharacterized protein [Nocardioides nitrophenolicus]
MSRSAGLGRSLTVAGRDVPASVLPALAASDYPSAAWESARRALADVEHRSVLIAVTGLSGAGKSVWLRQLVASASRARAIVVSADAFEQPMPYALADKLGHAAGVRIARPGEEPSLLDVARALVAALGDAAGPRRRQVIVVDNAQWVDEASVRVLRFVLGRLAHAGIVVVLAGHPGATDALADRITGGDPAGWQEVRRLRMPELGGASLRAYLSQVHGIEVSLRLADRLRELSGGLPVLVDQLASALRRTHRSHWDEDVSFRFLPENPFGGLAAEQPADLMAAVEVAATLRDPIRATQLEEVLAAVLPGDVVPARVVDDAVRAGLLVASDAGGDPAVAPFHDLFAADVVAQLAPARQTEILVAAAERLADPHRALTCRLQAAAVTATGLSDVLLAEVRRAVADAVAARQGPRAVSYLRAALAVADAGGDPALADGLVEEVCVLAAGLVVSPLVIDLIPRLEAMPPGPVRDLALLQTRQITGDVGWARDFVAELRADPPTPAEHPDAALIGMHTAMLAVLVQLTTGDPAPLLGLVDQALTAACAIGPGDEPPTDRRLAVLPSAEEVALRCRALSVIAAGMTGQIERLLDDYVLLDREIDVAADGPALADALVCRGSVLVGMGQIEQADADFARVLRLQASGVVGWSIGHGQVMAAYTRWLLGRYAEARAIVDDTQATILDDTDVSARPLYYQLRAVLAAARGDHDAYRRELAIMAEVTVTDYDTFGAELDLLHRVEHALATGEPELIVDLLAPERLAGLRLASQSIRSYRVAALCALGRAEQADAELAELRGLAGVGFHPVYASMDWLEGRVAEAYGLTNQALRGYRRAAAGPPGHTAALAAYDAGRLLLESGGSRPAARRLLRRAATELAALGRSRLADAAHLLLQREPESESSGALASLSAREREIARLAAVGHTNREIADRLGIAQPTVAFHIRNVLAKLGLTSRRELRDLGVG